MEKYLFSSVLEKHNMMERIFPCKKTSQFHAFLIEKFL